MKNQEGLQGNQKKSRQQLVNEITSSLAYEVEQKGLECEQLENNQIFVNLKLRLHRFFITREENRRFG